VPSNLALLSDYTAGSKAIEKASNYGPLIGGTGCSRVFAARRKANNVKESYNGQPKLDMSQTKALKHCD
jgi:hypothetical protein